MIQFKPNLHAAVLAAGLLAAPAWLLAQTPAEQSPPEAAQAAPLQAEPAAPIDEAKVEQFANAFVEVQKIQAQAAQELSATTEADKQIEVKANAEKDMVRAVERSGLEIEEFNQIASLMTTDLTLRSKVIDKVQKRSKG